MPGSGRLSEEELATHSSIFAGKSHGERSLAVHRLVIELTKLTQYTHMLLIVSM